MLFSKQNALVPKNSVWKKKRALRSTRRPFYPTFSQRAVRLSFVGSKAVQRKSKPSGNTHKIPFISDYRVVASAIFRLKLIGSPIQMNKWNKKMQMSLSKQTKKHKNVIKWHKNNCFIAYFFRLNVHSKKFKFPRGAMLLLGSLWLSNHWSFTVNQLIRKIT